MPQRFGGHEMVRSSVINALVGTLVVVGVGGGGVRISDDDFRNIIINGVEAVTRDVINVAVVLFEVFNIP